MNMSHFMDTDFFKCSTFSISMNEFKELVEAQFKRTQQGPAKRECGRFNPNCQTLSTLVPARDPPEF